MGDKEYIVEFLKRELHHSEYEKFEGLQESSKEKIERIINGLLITELDRLLEGFEKCESPIEEKLLMSLKFIEKEIEEYSSGRNFAIVNAQVPITLEGKTIRPDIQIGYYNTVEDWYQFLVIECDGHEFHEKTKEQAKKDKSRDRLLMANGYHVMRFTGSEIHNDPDACAEEVFKFIEYDLENRMKKKR